MGGIGSRERVEGPPASRRERDSESSVMSIVEALGGTLSRMAKSGILAPGTVSKVCGR